MLIVDPRLRLDAATMTAREMVEIATQHARLVWGRSLLAVIVVCVIAWRIDSVVVGAGLAAWDAAGPTIRAAGALAAVGALLLRYRVYGRADQLRSSIQNASMTASGDRDARGTTLLADALRELSQRERSIWTLAAAPALIAIPVVLLSGDAMPMIPLAAISFVVLALTFPRPERFAGEAGAIPGKTT